MGDNATKATKSAATSPPLLGSAVSPAPRCLQRGGGGGGGGMKLEALMETLQRQQEEKLRQKQAERNIRSMVESHIQHQAMALRRYQAEVRGALAAGDPGSSSEDDHVAHAEDRDPEDDCMDDDDDDYDDEDMNHPAGRAPSRAGQLPCATQGRSDPHEWTYEEQFKQLYELDEDEKRKEFLDDLFSFMQKRGTPVNRIPIMAKQVLDLYTLYKLVTEKGGLVEVINKKIWREITKGLNLPTSITSAAFTLRTQYMKYLYPYECEKRGLSSPDELQAAIDSNRREGRRQTYGSTLYSYTPVVATSILTQPHIANGSRMAKAIKQEDTMLSNYRANHIHMPVTLAGHNVAMAQAAAAHAARSAQSVVLEQLRESLECREPPPKKMLLMAEEQQSIMQHALQRNLLSMTSQLPINVKLHSKDDGQETALNLSTSGISSINMSIEINGVVYTGVLYAQKPATSGYMGTRGTGHTSSQGKAGAGQPPRIKHSSSSSSSSVANGLCSSSPSP
ncbi:AT-rich interactive domain-containing protein 3A-like [Arapaima gigas]